MKGASLPRTDQRLIQIVDAALAETVRKSGDWLVCRPGCTQCCVGVFAINQLDAARLRQGMADLKRKSPERAAKVRQRAREAVTRLAKNFPGDVETGLLAEGLSAEEQLRNLAMMRCVQHSIRKLGCVKCTKHGR